MTKTKKVVPFFTPKNFLAYRAGRKELKNITRSRFSRNVSFNGRGYVYVDKRTNKQTFPRGCHRFIMQMHQKGTTEQDLYHGTHLNKTSSKKLGTTVDSELWTYSTLLKTNPSKRVVKQYTDAMTSTTQAIIKYLERHGLVILDCQVSIYNPTLEFATDVDLMVWNSRKARLALIEVKTGSAGGHKKQLNDFKFFQNMPKGVQIPNTRESHEMFQLFYMYYTLRRIFGVNLKEAYILRVTSGNRVFLNPFYEHLDTEKQRKHIYDHLKKLVEEFRKKKK